MLETSRTHLLMVEDNPGDARLVEVMLAEVGGFRVSWVDSLAKAIEHLGGDARVDVVLLDLSLPDSQGMETVRGVRRAAPGVPIVIFTGLDDEEMGLRAVQEGCQDYLVKGQGDENLIRRTVNYAIERMSAEQALRESEDRYRGLVELSPDAIVVHRDGKIIFVNRAAVALFGASAPADMTEKSLDDLVHPEYGRGVTGVQAEDPDDVEGRYLEEKLLRLDGSAVDVEVAGSPIVYRGEPAQQLVIRDITERRRAEEGLRLASTVFQTTAEAIVVTDHKNRIKAVNPAFSRITGYGEDEVLGKDPGVLKSGRHEPEFYREMWEAMERDGHWEGEIWNRRKSGEIYPQWLSISSIRDRDGRLVEHVAVFSDITKRKQDEEQIRRQANYDALTGLPNRTLFMDRLGRAVVAARREKSMVGLLFIDLDRFKVVNDTLGHAFGDMLLEKAAKRLTGCVREADTVARLGGDEFTIILRDIHRNADAAMVGGEVIEALSAPFQLDGNEAFIGASIGITIYPNDAEDSATMLRNADMAMYKAKEAGRNAYRFFTPEMDEQALSRMTMEHDLRHALERDEFSVYFQPILEAETRELVGVEALLRWNHPRKGVITPTNFIQIAEDTGVISELGEWALRSACRQVAEWRAEGMAPFWLSVNLSSAQVKRGLTSERTAGIINETGLPPEAVTFEITERLIMGDTRASVDWLREVEALGCSLSVDDFGTGYSSLSYLRRFPVDMVKIDQSFVANVVEDEQDAALIEAVVALAHSLRMRVVAEGVETEDQYHFLKARGCDMVQGYLFGRPMAADAFRDYLSALPAPSGKTASRSAGGK